MTVGDQHKPKRCCGSNFYGNLPFHATYDRLSPYSGNCNSEPSNFSDTETTMHCAPVSRAALHSYSLAGQLHRSKATGVLERTLLHWPTLRAVLLNHLASRQQARRPWIQWAQTQVWQVVWRSCTPLSNPSLGANHVHKSPAVPKCSMRGSLCAFQTEIQHYY